MINNMQKAIIRKDIHGITANNRMLSVMFIVPLVLMVVMPTIFIISMYFSPEDEVRKMAALLESTGDALHPDDMKITAVKMLLNYVIPGFFLLIPIMASSVMAANAFVGEKEKKTLETLLYCPLPLKAIFSAKIMASFLLSMAVSAVSFIVMLIVFEIEAYFLTGFPVLPGISWLVVMLLVSPAVSILSINLIVRGSAKAQSSEESQQRSVFLVLPVVMLVASQFTGILLLNAWVLLALGAVLAAAALFTLRGSFAKFQYEMLLR